MLNTLGYYANYARETIFGVKDSTLFRACTSPTTTPEEIKDLIARGANVNALDHSGSPLHSAAFEGNTTTVIALLESGARVNDAVDFGGRTPLHIAAFKNHTEICQILLNAHAKVNAQDKRGFTPLHTALYQSEANIDIGLCKILLEVGADINIKTYQGESIKFDMPQTPLEMAINKGFKEVTDLLSTYAKNNSLKIR